MEQTYRVYIGGISPSLAASVDDLVSRLNKYGALEGKGIDLRRNEVQNTHFAFVSLKTTPAKVKSLQKVFNGVTFKDSKLVIDLAKPDWQERWQRDSRRQDTKIAQRAQRSKITQARLDRIEHRHDNPFDRALVVSGRMRPDQRKDVKNMTLRVEIKGRNKIVKCKKTKLWGVAKNRGVKDLTARFVAGEWRDGTDHVLDRVAVGADQNEKQVEIVEEHDKTNKVLSGLLSGYDFEKPVDLDEEDEPTAGSDYEFNNPDAEDLRDSGYLSVPAKDCVRPDPKDIVQEYLNEHPELLTKSTPVQQRLADEEEDDEEFYKTLRPKYDDEEDEQEEEEEEEEQGEGEELQKNPKVDEEGQEEEQSAPASAPATSDNHPPVVVDSDHDEEFMPSFGSAKTVSGPTEELSSEDEFIPTFGHTEDAPGTNTTEVLRSLLNPIEGKSDVGDIVPETEVPALETQNRARTDLGLFFGHFDSPFLVAQSQINKFNRADFHEEDWDKWFWESRGELNREFRRRRRDVLKRSRKAQGGKIGVI